MCTQYTDSWTQKLGSCLTCTHIVASVFEGKMAFENNTSYNQTCSHIMMSEHAYSSNTAGLFFYLPCVYMWLVTLFFIQVYQCWPARRLCSPSPCLQWGLFLPALLIHLDPVQDGAEYGSLVASSVKTLQVFVCFICFLLSYVLDVVSITV